MTLVDRIDLQSAKAAFAVANTPLFLMRKLRSDPAIALLARNRRGEEFLDALRDIAQREPTDLDELVLPYVYLVALSLKDDLSLLKEATQITQPYADWYQYIGNYLVQSTHPTMRKTVLFPHQIVIPRLSLTSSANTQRENIVLGG
jgi:hypothetical protein